MSDDKNKVILPSEEKWFFDHAAPALHAQTRQAEQAIKMHIKSKPLQNQAKSKNSKN